MITVDTVWTLWTSWTSWTYTCDYRYRSRERRCPGSNPRYDPKTPQYGGERDCLGDHYEQQERSSTPYCKRNKLFDIS